MLSLTECDGDFVSARLHFVLPNVLDRSARIRNTAKFGHGQVTKFKRLDRIAANARHAARRVGRQMNHRVEIKLTSLATRQFAAVHRQHYRARERFGGYSPEALLGVFAFCAYAIETLDQFFREEADAVGRAVRLLSRRGRF